MRWPQRPRPSVDSTEGPAGSAEAWDTGRKAFLVAVLFWVLFLQKLHL